MKTHPIQLLRCLALCLVASPLAAQTTLPAAPQPRTYGPSTVSYVRVPAAAFFPINSTDGYSGTVGGPRGANAFPITFQAPLQLPAGAKIVSLEFDFVDIDSQIIARGSLLACDALLQSCSSHPAAGAGPQDCIQAGNICSGLIFAGGAGSQSADLSPDNIVVDNVNGSYSLSAAIGFDSQIVGMLVGYVLQVSPAPQTATFSDVPTSDGAFQFIEAFAAAGITVGCQNPGDPPIYCPDLNVTRRQIAVFFAKALGLQFP